MTRNSMSALLFVGITGCLTPPGVDTPGTRPASPAAAPPPASGAEATPSTNGVTLLAPEKAAMLKEDGSVPDFPAELRVTGQTYTVLAKICVSKAGVVDRVLIVRGKEPAALATNVVNAAKTWRYKPLSIDGGPAVPFCHLAAFEFKPR